MNQVAILHGWSDESKSFRPLVAFLAANGYKAVPIWLGDYISMDDDVAVEDAAKGMEREVRRLQATGALGKRFDLIVHSTGGLISREWLSSYYDGVAAVPPVGRLVMLAPANFGSRLAKKGKSLIGRAFKGFWNGFQTGQRMLEALELSSRYTWKLACRDLLVPDDVVDDKARLYGEASVLPFVIVGTRAYEEAPRSLVNEDGSDGTVRPAAADLNAQGVTIDFSQDIMKPAIKAWTRRFAETIPIAVLPDRDHGSVILPGVGDRGAALGVPETPGDLILAALGCKDLAAYRAIGARWCGDDNDSICERTAKLAGRKKIAQVPDFGSGAMSAETYHQFMQLNVLVVDDHGDEVPDYFLEFPGSKKGDTDAAGVFFQKDVLQSVEVNSVAPARRTLLIDRTDLINGFYPRSSNQELYMRVIAEAVGRNVGYFLPPEDSSVNRQAADSVGMIRVHAKDANQRWLSRNATHLVKVIVPREPSAKVFRLSRA